MSNHPKLRELAAKATQGECAKDFDDVWSDDGIGGRSIVCRDHLVAQYICAASPMTVLALLDELDRLTEELRRYTEAYHG